MPRSFICHAAGGELRQRRAVQLDGPHGLHQLRALVAALPRCRGKLKRLVALRRQRPVVHAVLDAGAFKGRVAVPRPRLAPTLQNLDLVPVAVLGGEALGTDLAGGQQNMGMMVALVARAPRCVQGDVGHHAPVHEMIAHERPHQRHPLVVGQLGGQGHADLAGDLAVLAGLGFLDAVPQLGSVADPIRRVVRGENFGVINTGARRVIEGQPGAAVLDALGHAVGDGRRGAAALAPGNHRCA